MNLEKIDAAIAEAKRFIKTAEALKSAKKKRHDKNKNTPWGEHSTVENAHCPREQGALRRASMDLTRALADLRKSN